MKAKAKKSKATRRGRVSPIPAGYHAVTPYLAIKGAAKAIDFYRRAFGADEIMRMPGAKGGIGHAEMQLGDSRVMLADEHPDIGFLGPKSRGGSAVHMNLYVEDVDKVVQRAVKAGAKLTRPVQDMFYGDRGGSVQDPFGHTWHVATHVEDVSAAEMKKRAAKQGKG
jgi:PhnB protein